MEARDLLTETCNQLLREEVPNLFRLYLNPYVAQTCLCLERYVQCTWHATADYQSFLANSFDEALSGAIKLARYHASVVGKPTTGLVLDPAGKLGPFAAASARGERVEFVPGLVILGKDAPVPPGQSFGFVVLVNADLQDLADEVRRLVRAQAATLIVCVDRARLHELGKQGSAGAVQPDLVVFDDSFVHHEVPFGAFTARQELYDHWNQGAKATFHSTTFQPNSISTLHFLRCLQADDAAFHASIAPQLARIGTDLAHRKQLFRRLYSPSLANAIAMTNCETAEVRAAGHYVCIDGRQVFDAVGGVACSVRGHNPPTYAAEISALAATDCVTELTARLHELTGLDGVLPAVSGASAVENALKLALVAQFPRRHVLALKAGFGGKTLLALTSTWSASYKEHIGPLYGDVSYVDPFASDALAQIDSVLAAHAVAVVQIELIQGVGGVRQVPAAVVRHLAAGRARHGYLLLLDEVQTGMHRTGPFTMSRALGITPDLLVIGKAISDMMFPFALTLYAKKAFGSTADMELLAEAIRTRHHYACGYKTALNALRFAERMQLADKVSAAGALFAKLLQEELASCPAVREVRVFGLLIGIELNAKRWPQRWFKKRLFWFYLAAMLREQRFPVLVGFCQAEPNVLKITPPLTIEPTEIRAMCATIGAVLRRPFYRLLAAAVGSLIRTFRLRRSKREHTVAAAHGSLAR